MKPTNQFGVTIFAGGTLALLGLCSSALAIPPVLGAICVLIGILILIEGSHRLKNAKVRGPDTHGTMMPHDASHRARIRFVWFVAFGLVLACVLLIPALPYVFGDASSQFIYAVVPAQVGVVAAFLYYLRRRLLSQRSSSSEEGV